MAPAQVGHHADGLLPAARIERAVVDRRDNFGEGVKRDIWEFTALDHDGAAILFSKLLDREIKAEIKCYVT